MDLDVCSYHDPFYTDCTINHIMHDENFRHHPRNLEKDPIRLIKVLPDLPADGLIICEIWHATTRSKHQYVSYRWGSQKDPRTILIRDIQSVLSEGKESHNRQKSV
jgi:hypothetical protein